MKIIAIILSLITLAYTQNNIVLDTIEYTTKNNITCILTEARSVKMLKDTNVTINKEVMLNWYSDSIALNYNNLNNFVKIDGRMIYCNIYYEHDINSGMLIVSYISEQAKDITGILYRTDTLKVLIIPELKILQVSLTVNQILDSKLLLANKKYAIPLVSNHMKRISEKL